MALHGLDRIDGEILDILQTQARLPNKEVAERVGIAPSTCLERIRRLLNEKVLLGFRAEVSPQALGSTLQALLAVRLQGRSRKEVEAFRRYALELREVVMVYHLAGPFDFLLQVNVRDAEHLREVTLDAFGSRPEVAHTETFCILQAERSPLVPDYASRRDQEAEERHREQEFQALKESLRR